MDKGSVSAGVNFPPGWLAQANFPRLQIMSMPDFSSSIYSIQARFKNWISSLAEKQLDRNTQSSNCTVMSMSVHLLGTHGVVAVSQSPLAESTLYGASQIEPPSKH